MNFSFKKSPHIKSLLFILITLTPLTAEERPPIKQLDQNHYQIGNLTLNKTTREITFPALINMREGLLEFLIVHQNGKIHESLLRTTTSPTHINLAFTLLRYKPSKELYRTPQESELPIEKFFVETPENKKAAKISIHLEYKQNGETKRIQISDWIKNEITAKTMPPTHWVYGGSEIYEGKYLPEITGDIAAIFITNSAIINYPGRDNLNDEIWTTVTSRIPQLETPVTVIISPHSE